MTESRIHLSIECSLTPNFHQIIQQTDGVVPANA